MEKKKMPSLIDRLREEKGRKISGPDISRSLEGDFSSPISRPIDDEFTQITEADDLALPVRALYIAETIAGTDDALSKSSYFAAALGFKRYEVMIKERANIKGEVAGPSEVEMGEYLGIVKQMTQHCLDKSGYFPKSADAGKGGA